MKSRQIFFSFDCISLSHILVVRTHEGLLRAVKKSTDLENKFSGSPSRVLTILITRSDQKQTKVVATFRVAGAKSARAATRVATVIRKLHHHIPRPVTQRQRDDVAWRIARPLINTALLTATRFASINSNHDAVSARTRPERMCTHTRTSTVAFVCKCGKNCLRARLSEPRGPVEYLNRTARDWRYIKTQGGKKRRLINGTRLR